MPKYLLMFAALILGACNLSAPGSPADIATPTLEPEYTSIPPRPQDITLIPHPVLSDAVGYANAMHSYGIQYPPNVSLVENPADGSVLIDDQIEIRVSDLNPEEAHGDGMLIEDASTEQVWNRKARRLKGYVGAVGGGIPHSLEQVVVPYNGLFYILTISEIKYSTPYSDTTAAHIPGPIPAAELELFNKILSTLRFPDDRSEP